MKLTLKDILNLLLLPFLVYEFNTNFLSFAPNFYNNYSVDTLSHFLGGLTIAYSIYYTLSLIEKNDWIIIKKNNLKAVIIVAVTVSVAVCWEFYEFLSDHFLGTLMQPSNADTIKDLSMGMLGSIIFSTIFLHKINSKKS